MFFCAGCREPLHALHRLQCVHTLSHYDQVTFEQCGDPRSAWRSACSSQLVTRVEAIP